MERYERQDLRKRTFGALFWMSSAVGTRVVLQFAVLAVLARLLSPHEFGVVAAALMVVRFSTVLSQLGVGPAVVQRPELEKRHVRTAFTLSLLFGLAMTGATWLSADLIGSFFHMEELPPVVRALSPLFALEGLSSVSRSLLQRELRFRPFAGIDAVSYGLGFGAGGISLALAGHGLWALVGGQFAQGVLQTALLLAASPHPKRPLLERRSLRDLLGFGGGFTLGRLGNYVAGQADYLVVGRVLGPVALGVYGRAYQLMAAPANILGQVLDRVLFPAMAKVQSDPGQLALAWRRGVALVTLTVLPLSLALLVLAPELVEIMLGPGWSAVVGPFRVLVGGLVLRTSYKMSDSLARATGAVYQRAWRQWVYALLVGGGAWAGTGFGLEGVAFGVLAAIVVNFGLMAQLSLGRTELRWSAVLEVHRPAMLLTAVTTVPILACATLLRSASLPAPWVAVGSGLGGALGLWLLLLLHEPRPLLGDDGLWLLRMASSRLPKGLLARLRIDGLIDRS
jgi:PST family polysaccharide transporter